MADRKVNIVLKARDEASKVFENVANNTLPQFAKRIAQGIAGFASVAALEETVRRSVDAALEAEKATAGLAAALRAQGKGAESALPGLKAHAEALSRMALADDEAVQGAQRVLVSVGGLSGPKLDEATKAVLDLSAGLGVDLEQAATMVSKAAQGSTKEFSRLGFEFQKNATDAEKLDAVLAGVQKRFGGMAAAEIATASGKLHELNEAFGELLETLGTNFIRGVANVDGLTRALQNLNDEANKPGTLGFWKSLGLILTDLVATKGTGTTAFTIVAADAARANAQLSQLIANEQALANFDDPFGFWDAKAVEKAAKDSADLAKNEEEAKKRAEDLAKAIAKINEETSTQVLAPKKPEEKTPIMSEASDFVLQNTIDKIDADRLAAEAINEQRDAYVELLKPVNSIDEAYERIGRTLKAISDATPEQQAQLIAMANAMVDSAKEAESMGATIANSLKGAAANAAVQLGDLLVDAATGAKVSWSDAIQSIIVGLIKAVVQAAILKLMETAFAASSGGVVGSGSLAGGIARAASGGAVIGQPRYLATGGALKIFKPRGTDTVPAMLTPGEVVLPRNVAQALLHGEITIERGGRNTGGRSILGGRLATFPAASNGPTAFASGGIVSGFTPAPSLPARSTARGRVVNLNISAVDKRGIRELLIEHSDALGEALDYIEARG